MSKIIKTFSPFLILVILCGLQDIAHSSWEEWWTYDGISGPGFWGLINPQWNMCNKGRRQSPINVEPDKLLFDPYLRPLHIDKHKISGTLQNSGQSLVFRVDKDSKQHVNISGGPLAYRYQFEEIYIHYGTENNQGSEHQIHGYAFPGEIQLYGFNKELYHNMSEAQHKAQGIVGISLMVQIGETLTNELRMLTSTFNKVTYKGSSTQIKHLSLKSLLPNTEQYMTYEGSTTHPGCWESVVWVILNKPIYITKQELYALRRLMQGSEQTPKAPLGNNARPLQPLHHRTIRTNIDFAKVTEHEAHGYYRTSKKRIKHYLMTYKSLNVTQNSGVTPKDCNVTQNSVVTPKSLNATQNSGVTPKDKNVTQNSGVTQKDYNVTQNSWVTPKDNNVTQNSGVTPKDYNVTQNSWVTPEDNNVTQNSGLTPKDYNVTQNSGLTPKNYNVT